MQAVLQAEACMELSDSSTQLPDCTVFLLCEPILIKKLVPRIVLQPIELRLSLSSQSFTSISIPISSSTTNQRSSPLTNQDQTARIWKSSFALEQTNQGPGARTSLCKPALLWLSKHTFPFLQRLKILFALRKIPKSLI